VAQHGVTSSALNVFCITSLT